MYRDTLAHVYREYKGNIRSSVAGVYVQLSHYITYRYSRRIYRSVRLLNTEMVNSGSVCDADTVADIYVLFQEPSLIFRDCRDT